MKPSLSLFLIVILCLTISANCSTVAVDKSASALSASLPDTTFEDYEEVYHNEDNFTRRLPRRSGTRSSTVTSPVGGDERPGRGCRGGRGFPAWWTPYCRHFNSGEDVKPLRLCSALQDAYQSDSDGYLSLSGTSCNLKRASKTSEDRVSYKCLFGSTTCPNGSPFPSKMTNPTHPKYVCDCEVDPSAVDNTIGVWACSTWEACNSDCPETEPSGSCVGNDIYCPYGGTDECPERSCECVNDIWDCGKSDACAGLNTFLNDVEGSLLSFTNARTGPTVSESGTDTASGRLILSECPEEKEVFQDNNFECAENLSCGYGSESCCGKEHPTSQVGCSEGDVEYWEFFTDACLSPNCANNCPATLPNGGDVCDSNDFAGWMPLPESPGAFCSYNKLDCACDGIVGDGPPLYESLCACVSDQWVCSTGECAPCPDKTSLVAAAVETMSLTSELSREAAIDPLPVGTALAPPGDVVECPTDQPLDGDVCTFGAGDCWYGNGVCCGVTFKDVVCTCESSDSNDPTTGWMCIGVPRDCRPCIDDGSIQPVDSLGVDTLANIDPADLDTDVEGGDMDEADEYEEVYIECPDVMTPDILFYEKCDPIKMGGGQYCHYDEFKCCGKSMWRRSCDCVDEGVFRCMTPGCPCTNPLPTETFPIDADAHYPVTIFGESATDGPLCPQDDNPLVMARCDTEVWGELVCQYGNKSCPFCDTDQMVPQGPRESCTCDAESGQWFCWESGCLEFECSVEDEAQSAIDEAGPPLCPESMHEMFLSEESMQCSLERWANYECHYNELECGTSCDAPAGRKEIFGPRESCFCSETSTWVCQVNSCPRLECR